MLNLFAVADVQMFIRVAVEAPDSDYLICLKVL